MQELGRQNRLWSVSMSEQEAREFLTRLTSFDEVKTWRAMFEWLGPMKDYVVYKWSLDVNDWAPGEAVRRPRTPEELAPTVRASAAQIPEMDEIVLDACKPLLEPLLSSEDPNIARIRFECMLVPIGVAQAWWDEKHGSTYFPNGDFRVTCKKCDHLNRIPRRDMAGPRARRKLPCGNCRSNLRKQR